MDLYLITNRNLIIGDRTLASIVKQAVSGGIDAIILREKDLPSDELLEMAGEIKKIITGRPVKLIINHNLQVAKAVEADGYHTSFEDFITNRPFFKGYKGVSIHNPEEAVIAEKDGASYLLASHIFATDCKKGLPPKGLRLIKDIKARVSIPVIALGGINPNNAGEVLRAGADGIAVMSFIMQSNNPSASVLELKKSGLIH